jgi:hypothetical protein
MLNCRSPLLVIIFTVVFLSLGGSGICLIGAPTSEMDFFILAGLAEGWVNDRNVKCPGVGSNQPTVMFNIALILKNVKCNLTNYSLFCVTLLFGGLVTELSLIPSQLRSLSLFCL